MNKFLGESCWRVNCSWDARGGAFADEQNILVAHVSTITEAWMLQISLDLYLAVSKLSLVTKACSSCKGSGDAGGNAWWRIEGLMAILDLLATTILRLWAA